MGEISQMKFKNITSNSRSEAAQHREHTVTSLSCTAVAEYELQLVQNITYIM